MKLSATPLIDVVSVNDYVVSTQAEYTVGDATTVYLQLVDLDKASLEYGWQPAGLRYMPISATQPTLEVTFINIDDARQIARFASQPFTQDPSIWSVDILPTDVFSGTISLKCVLTENKGTSQVPVSVTKTFTVKAAVLARA